jgi:hypothetical protein
VHRRAVWLRPDSYLLIYDEFVGTGEHELAVNYQFAPGTLTLAGAGRALFEGSIDIAWAGNESWNVSIACGGAEPADGWIAPSLGVRQAAPRLTLTCRMARPRATLLTVIAPRAAPETRIAMQATEQGTMPVVNGSDYTDCVWGADVSPRGVIDTDALLVVCRMERGGTMKSASIGASRLHIDAAALRALCAPARHGTTVTK